MNVILISQCDKNALTETRRILDQFAERKGDRTWHTPITLEGLKTLRKMLKSTARRNTAVACHWVRGQQNFELLWIVGQAQRFSMEGNVPTNTTSRDMLRADDENQWATGEALAILAGIAGLFHDMGKANALFQAKLKKSQKVAEPYRHEWVSMKCFEAFVAGRSDAEWLSELQELDATSETNMLARLKANSQTKDKMCQASGSVAQVVAWLVVSHHRLLHSDQKASLNDSKNWMADCNDTWNANKTFNAKEKNNPDNWAFPHGTPMQSTSWRQKAQALGKRAEQCFSALQQVDLNDLFTVHLARLTLMLADHHYSSQAPTPVWQDPKYGCHANTDRKTGKLKQKLDEHNVGVGHHSFLLAKQLPKLRQQLPSIRRHAKLKRRTTLPKFQWQNKCYDQARSVQARAEKQGFFGINLASTGCGKTLANARIMYGLANEKRGCRFSVALGLRTLTLQTSAAFQDKLGFDEEDMATLMGSTAVKNLFEAQQENEQQRQAAQTFAERGSESAEDFMADDHVRYDGQLYDGALNQWLAQKPKMKKMLSAPITVSTIDYLIKASEGVRGGQQIAPMLRLLTSDLVIDEPDDFGLEDLPALYRLVHWAGLLGSKVLLSSATIAPALAYGLFEAYQKGRSAFQQARGEVNQPTQVVCAWFDEFRVVAQAFGEFSAYKTAHQQFIEHRIAALQKNQLPLRQGYFVDVVKPETPQGLPEAFAKCYQATSLELHRAHHLKHASGKTASVGLIRMANIKPLVAVADALMQLPAVENTCFHLCVYHSQFPLLIRSTIESKLDRILKRDPKHPEAFWEQPEVQAALKQPEQQHVFLVLATPVAEVGRDHDYDWAIVEPSSMRSIIQLAGRVQRHRQQAPEQPNIAVLSQNFKALNAQDMPFSKPGFECNHPLLKVNNNKLNQPTLQKCIKNIDAQYRVQCYANETKPAYELIAVEHKAMYIHLIKKKGENIKPANCWLQPDATLFGNMQRHQPFRKSTPQSDYWVFLDEDDGELRFGCLRDDPQRSFFDSDNIEPWAAAHWQPAHRFWFELDYLAIVTELQERFDLSFNSALKTYMPMPLRSSIQAYSFHRQLGAFEPLQKF